ILLEIALIHYMQNLDLSMQCGRVVTELIGKIEYQMAELQQAAEKQAPQELQPPGPQIDNPPKP
ncbi:hypothetical protein LCGC14_3131230, partial [marine sediment metagenome]